MVTLAAATGAGIGSAAAAFRASLVPNAEFSVTAAVSTGDFSRSGLVGLFGIRLIALTAGTTPSAVTLGAGLVELAFSLAASAGHLPLVIAMTAADQVFIRQGLILGRGLEEEYGENGREGQQLECDESLRHVRGRQSGAPGLKDQRIQP